MAEQTTNFGLHKPGTEDFYDVGVFNENADLIDGILKEQETALEGKAVDDFTHIPLALCETAGDAAEKEITIPGYTEEKYPIIAVKFANSNTDPAMKLSVNGGDALPVSTGNEISQWVGPETYPMSKGAVVLLSKRGNGRAWSVVGTHNAATDHNYGVVKLINSPDKPGYITNRDVTTPSFVNTLFNRTLSNYQDAATYPVNALVMQDGAIYKSLQDDNTGHAVTDAEWWEQYGGTVTLEPDPEQVINYTMLYDQGDECAAVTGGWRATAYDNRTTIGPQKNSSHLKFTKVANGSSVQTSMTNKISTVGFTRLYTVGGTDCLSAATTNVLLFHNVLATQNIAASVENNKVTQGLLHYLDLSPYQSDYYVCVADGSIVEHNLKVYDVFMLKFDDPARLISTAGITTTYTTPEALAANASARAAILSSPKAVKTMTLTCTGDLMYAILNNTDWITAIKANDEAYRIIMSNPHWSKFAGIIPAAKDLLGYTMLYDQGDECEAVTGGWNGIYKEPGNYTTSQLTLGQSDMFGAVPSGALTWKYRACTNSIDLSEHEKILCCFSFSSTVKENGNSMSFRIAKDTTWPSDAVQALALNSDQTVVNKGYVAKIFDVPVVRKIGYIIIDLLGTGVTAVAASGSYKLLCALRADSWQSWAAKGGLTASYADLDTLLSDSSAMAILMSNRDAISYMISCTGTLMAAICNSETAMSALVNSPVAYDATFTNSHWRKFMLMCPVSLAAMDSVAKTVPLMTAADQPEGLVSAMNYYTDAGYALWGAFNKGSYPWGTLSAKNQCNMWYLQYDFTTDILPYKCFVIISNGSSATSRRLYKIQGKVGEMWVDLSSEIDSGNFAGPNLPEKTIILNPVRCRSLRLQFTGQSGDLNYSGAKELQFYGKEVL